MNARLIVMILGTVTVLLGLGGVVAPQFVMQRVVGFAVDPGFSANFVHGEVRAVYGGMFAVLGLQTLWAAIDPHAHRQRLLVVASLWIGLCVGRLISITIDGSPGALGWFSVAFEAVFGAALLACAFSPERSAAAADPTPSRSFA
jgi:hypothetical protein